MDRQDSGEQVPMKIDKGWYYLDKSLLRGGNGIYGLLRGGKEIYAAVDKATGQVIGMFSESVKVEEGAKIRDSRLYGEVFVSKDSSIISSEVGNREGGSIIVVQGKSNISYSTIRTGFVKENSQVLVIDSNIKLATFRAKPGTITIRNSNVIGTNPPTITTHKDQINRFLSGGIIVDSLVYLGYNNNLDMDDYIINNSKINLDNLDGRSMRSRIISNVDCLKERSVISLPIINNNSMKL